MASIYNKTNQLYENPKRNTFDLSFQNNLTLNMGDLVPCFCKEVLPGDSFKIDPTISLRTMPLIFPVQTRLRAYLHFFYVTNRSLWSDWMDFIGKTKDGLELPYVDYKHKTGSLGDYLGLPTTVVAGTPAETHIKYFSGTYSNILKSGSDSDGNSTYSFSLSPTFSESPTPILYDALSLDGSFSWADFWRIFNDVNGALGISGSNGHNVASIPRLSNRDSRSADRNGPNNIITNLDGQLLITPTHQRSVRNVLFYAPVVSKYQYSVNGKISNIYGLGLGNVLDYIHDAGSDFHSNGSVEVIFKSNHSDSSKDMLFRYTQYLSLNQGLSFNIDDEYPVSLINSSNVVATQSTFRKFAEDADNIEMCVLFTNIKESLLIEDSTTSGPEHVLGDMRISRSSGGRVVTFSLNPSVGSSPYLSLSDEPLEITDSSININSALPKVSALPFRAYEAIYNSFYRDDRNNPLIIDDTPVYNKFIRNYDGGKDDVVTTELYQRNWESDFLTSAVQSPQQGVAPLVGITSYGQISFKDAETGEIYSAKLNSSDGDTIESFTVTSPNMPNSNLKQLVDFATSGISISDLRGVNALQRWLEINMRRGLRYKDQIMSHFGVDVKYDELMMPEFIGGMTQDIYINQINQTTPSEGAPLGSIAGQGGAFGSSPHSINHYCQEHGYIIGIISIAPTPQYSQLLPKHFLKRETLDYFFPEFGHLGPQPITYAEVAPNESLMTKQSLNDVFGYQRAWYDYLGSTDEVHGLFRTNLNNFVVQRFFDGRPELGKSFLTINPQALDSVFAVESSDISHKFIGQIYFDCKAKRPIPEYGIPKLEV